MGHVGMGWGRVGHAGVGGSCRGGVGHVGVGMGHAGVWWGGVCHALVGWVM